MTDDVEGETEQGKADFETIRRAFAVFDGFEGPPNDDLWWRTDGDYAPVTLFVNCNDVFLWGCSDCEVVGPGSIGILEQAYADAKAIGQARFTDALYCARRRELRPQGAFYAYLTPKMAALFDACGPEREIGLGNPKPNKPGKEDEPS
jgi:hypothetical protein